MAWMIVEKDVNYRRKNGPFFHVKPALEPQNYPRDVVDYAVRIGAAKRVAPPPKTDERR